MSKTNPDMTIYADMLTDGAKVAAVLKKQREFVSDKYGSLSDDDVLPEDREILASCKAALENDFALEDILRLILEAGAKVRLEDMQKVVSLPGNMVVERSHGVLTDSETGLKPHVSSLRTLPHFTDLSLRTHGYEGEIIHYGVHRAYSVRHGAGPLPTADPKLREQLLPGSCKDDNRWQGQVRVGPLDFVLINYALHACKLFTEFDGICVTWFDQIVKNGTWNCCTNYVLGDKVFLPYKLRNIDLLKSVKTPLKSFSIPTNRDEQTKLCRQVFETYTGLPVRMISFGPCKEDKEYMEV